VIAWSRWRRSLLGFLQWGSLARAAGARPGLAWIQRRNDEHHGESRSERGRMALTAGFAASLAFVGLQALALQQARGIVAAELARIDAGERMLDTALSAYPANPLCWSFVTVARTGTDDSGTVHLRRGMLSIAPAPGAGVALPRAHRRAGARRCAAADRLAGGGSRAGGKRCGPWRRGLPRERLVALCTRALAGGWLATDLRWGEPGSRNFLDDALWRADSQPCPKPVPGWGYPRADLLHGH
jgi:inner membrane protein